MKELEKELIRLELLAEREEAERFRQFRDIVISTETKESHLPMVEFGNNEDT